MPIAVSVDTMKDKRGKTEIPERKDCLSSLREILSQSALLVFYVFVETAGALLNSRVLKPNHSPEFTPLPSSMTTVHAGLSILVGLFIVMSRTAYSEGSLSAFPRKAMEVFHLRNVCHYSLVAACYTTQGVFSYLAYSRLDAGLKKVLDQARIPVVAAMSSIVLGKRYTLSEWLTLLVVFLGIVCFYLADVEHDKVTEMHQKCRYPAGCFSQPPYDLCAIQVDGRTVTGIAIRNFGDNFSTTHDVYTWPLHAAETDRRGLFFSLMAILCNGLGSVFAEKVLKSRASTPFVEQKLQMESTGLPVAFAMAFIVPLWIDPKGGQSIWWTTNETTGSGAGFFQGFSHLTWGVIAINMFQTWVGGMVTKRFSALVAKLSTCITLMLTVILSGTLFKPCEADLLPITMFALAAIIAAITLLFAFAPKLQQVAPALPPARENLIQMQDAEDMS